MWSKILAQHCWCWKVGQHQESVFCDFYIWRNTWRVPGFKDHTLYNDILCLFCLGTRANFEDEKNSVTLCVNARVVMETTWELFWEKDEKHIRGIRAAWPVVKGMEVERRVPLTTASHLSGEQAELLPVDTLVSTLSELSRLRVSYVDSPAGGAWWCRIEWCTMGAPEDKKGEWAPCGAPQWLWGSNMDFCLGSVGRILESSYA